MTTDESSRAWSTAERTNELEQALRNHDYGVAAEMAHAIAVAVQSGATLSDEDRRRAQ